MPLSIFHSDFHHVPEKNWGKMLIIASIIFSFVFISWEFFVRSKGYVTSLDTYPGLWSMNRDKLEKIENPVVLLGMSRAAFGLDLPGFEKEYGKRVLQLSHVGIPAMPIFDRLANDETFRGNIVLSVIEAISFIPGGPMMERTYNLLNYYDNQTLSQKYSYYLHMLLDEKLASLCKEDLTLQAGIRILNFALGFREGVKVMPEPPFCVKMNRQNQGKMIEKVITNEGLRNKLIFIWQFYFNKIIPQLPQPVIDMQYQKYKENVDKIRARGGDVVFIRMPSSGSLREVESKRFPKTLFDDLLNVTNTKGVHFEDYEEISNFICPEESHLSPDDSKIYTRNLIEIFKELNISL